MVKRLTMMVRVHAEDLVKSSPVQDSVIGAALTKVRVIEDEIFRDPWSRGGGDVW